MSILVDADTRLCVSGITGREGTFHSLRNRDYGTQVVGGVTPGKGGQDVDGVPVFNTFHEAVDARGANTAMIFVPPRFAADSILEAEDAGIGLIVAITSMKSVPGTGSPPIPTIVELPKPCWAMTFPIWYVRVPDRETTPTLPSRKNVAGMIPTVALPGDRIPGQFGPISRVVPRRRCV